MEHIELSSKNGRLRLVLIGILLVIAAVSLTAGLTALLRQPSGWQQVEANAQGVHCGGDFVLYYDFDDSTDQKQLTQVYSDAVVRAWQLFSSGTGENGNLAYLNAHVNETVTVDPALYDALALAAAYENRHIFLGPAASEYEQIFLFENAAEAAQYDPGQNGELMDYVRQAAGFAANPAAVSLEILEDHQVKLSVSGEYLAFARQYEIREFVDFGWMKNAFIADFLASRLEEAGFTRGYLVSYDGFTRNLDTRNQGYAMNIFDRQGNEVNLPAKMHYTGPISIVSLRNYPMGSSDRWHYYSFADTGRIATVMIDPADGADKSALHNLVCYSREKGCGEIVLQAAPIFIADTFSEDALQALTGQEIYAVWPQGTELRYNEEALELELLRDTGLSYTASLTQPGQ